MSTHPGFADLSKVSEYHAQTLPEAVTEFLSKNPDSAVRVLSEPTLAPVDPSKLHPSLSAHPSAAAFSDFDAASYPLILNGIRVARSEGQSHQVASIGGAKVHLSFVDILNTPLIIMITHPTTGLGGRTLAPVIKSKDAIRGRLDERLAVTAIDGGLPGIDATDGLLGRDLTALVADESVSDALDCWLEAWTLGTSWRLVTPRQTESSDEEQDPYRLDIIVAGGEAVFSIVASHLVKHIDENIDRQADMDAVAQTVPQGFFRVSQRGALVQKNSKLEDLLGRPVENMSDLGDLVTTDGSKLLEIVPEILAKEDDCVVDVSKVVDGAVRMLRIRVTLDQSESSDEVEYVGFAEDVTESIERELQLEQEALTDPMTGAANRRALEIHLTSLLEEDSYEQFAVLLCDLDGFKQVNDSLGHGAGDMVIEEVGRRLRDVSRDEDLVARLGGDEFVIVLRAIESYDEGMEYAERILPLLRQPYSIDDTQIELSGSVGVALSTPGNTTHGVLQMADHAMYEAKRSGRNQAVAYHTPDSTLEISPLALRRDLRRAIMSDGLDLAFQPIFEIDNPGEAVAAEALLRWEHPVQGRIEPATMVSIAEQSGLIHDLGEWIIAESIRSAASVSHDSTKQVSINVNVSALQVGRPEFVDMVGVALDFHQLKPSLLTIELTESFLIDQLDTAREAIVKLTELGVNLAIDDFGTGYSTFEYLLTLPVSAVKIDPSFTKRLTERRGAAMLRGLSMACRELGMSVVCEGIETFEQFEAAREAGVTHAQGYLLGMPVSSSSLGMRANSNANRAA